jgi:hypothetical protein
LDAGARAIVSSRAGAAMIRLQAAGLAALAVLGCAASPPPPAASPAPPFPVGPVSLQALLAATPSWGRDAAGPEAAPEAAVVELLAAAPSGWSLETVYGAWCSDSAREVPRLLRILDILGERAPPATWVAVDRAKREPADVIARLRIERVPTIIVRRSGREVGRIVEASSPSLERNLLAIVDPAAAASVAVPPP